MGAAYVMLTSSARLVGAVFLKMQWLHRLRFPEQIDPSLANKIVAGIRSGFDHDPDGPYHHGVP